MTTTITTRTETREFVGEVTIASITGTVASVTTRRALAGGFHLVTLDDGTQVRLIQSPDNTPVVGATLTVDAIQRPDGVYRLDR